MINHTIQKITPFALFLVPKCTSCAQGMSKRNKTTALWNEVHALPGIDSVFPWKWDGPWIRGDGSSPSPKEADRKVATSFLFCFHELSMVLKVAGIYVQSLHCSCKTADRNEVPTFASGTSKMLQFLGMYMQSLVHSSSAKTSTKPACWQKPGADCCVLPFEIWNFLLR